MRTAIAFMVLLAGCSSTHADSTGTSPSAQPSAANPDAVELPVRAAKLKRTATPEERRAKDEAACDSGDAIACRKAADRYTGYGHAAGCGVDRKRKKPYRKVIASDQHGDRKAFDHFARKICELGNDEGCAQVRLNIDHGYMAPVSRDGCVKSAAADCPLVQWQAVMHPDKRKAIEEDRTKNRYYYPVLQMELFRKQEKRGGPIPADVAELATKICKTSLECDDVFLMLDKNAYEPAGLEPIRKAAGEALTAACLEGDCTCGEATRYLDPGDARVVDLAQIGCDDGDMTACYALGRAYEEGKGVDKDERLALSLYRLACPAVVNTSRGEEIAKAACDRLAELYEEGRAVEKDDESAYFYSSLACDRGGFERDHMACIRRGVFISKGMGERGDDPREYFYGIVGDPVNRKECERPSVKEACEREKSHVPPGR